MHEDTGDLPVVVFATVVATAAATPFNVDESDVVIVAAVAPPHSARRIGIKIRYHNGGDHRAPMTYAERVRTHTLRSSEYVSSCRATGRDSAREKEHAKPRERESTRGQSAREGGRWRRGHGRDESLVVRLTLSVSFFFSLAPLRWPPVHRAVQRTLPFRFTPPLSLLTPNPPLDPLPATPPPPTTTTTTTTNNYHHQ